jgi:hypothetical protein
MFLVLVLSGIEGISRGWLAAYWPAGRMSPSISGAGQTAPADTLQRRLLQAQLDVSVSAGRTRRIVADLASMPSRVVGYPGNAAAYRYVREAFGAAGLQDIAADTFYLAMPVDHGGRLTLADTGESVPIHAFWPNKVRTPTLPRDGLAGPLVYGGKGRWRDLDGKTLDGSIVLMDFDSADQYRNARMMGARAIVFFDNGIVSRGEAEWKVEEIPLDIPRFWVRREDALRLLAAADRQPAVRLEARMTWERVPAWNVYGWIPGRDAPMPADPSMRWKDRLIVLTAHYDAMSVAPAVAPGAEHAAGIAGLIQIAQALNAYGPGYSILCLATSGHFVSLAGISDFFARHARNNDRFLASIPPENRLRPDLVIGLDLSSGSDRVVAYSEANLEFFDKQQQTAILKRSSPFARRFEAYAQTHFGSEASARYLDGILPVGRSPGDFFPTFIAMDHEAAHRNGFNAFSLVTPNDVRSRVDTPADLPEYVDFDALARQIETVAVLLFSLTRDPEAFDIPEAAAKDLGHELNGRVVEWDRSREFFTPRTPLPGALVTLRAGWGSFSGVRTLMTTLADTAGYFTFRNIPTRQTLRVRSYVFDEDGRIVYAPDQGEEGAKMFPLDLSNTPEVSGCVQVLFRCQPLELMETIDPASLFELGALTVLNADNAGLRKFGTDFYDDFGGKSAVIYAQPGAMIKALAGAGPASIQYLMTNTPEDMLLKPVPPGDITEAVRTRAQGRGYPADEGFIPYPMYRTAQDLWVLDDVRLNGMIRHGVKNDRASLLHEQARQALLRARDALAGLNYSGFVAESRKAWGLEVRAYPDIKATADDTVRGVIFYFILVLPFAFIMERLFFGFADIRKQMGAFGGLFVLVFLVLQRVHPAFKLSMTPYIVFLAFVIMALGMIVMFILLSRFNAEMNRVKHQASGIHEADIGRLSATGVAISLGISNIRKRKLRSTLTAATLVLLTFTVLSFTSYSTAIQFYKIVRPNSPSYQGAMIRYPSWWSLDPLFTDYLEGALGEVAVIAPRGMWMTNFTTSRVDYANPATGQSSFITSLMGFSPHEPLVTGIDTLLVPGSRWFRPGERDVCILPTEVAARIGITPAQTGAAAIRMMGLSYRVIGLIEAGGWGAMRDLDDERLTPITFKLEGTPAFGEFGGLFNMTAGDHVDPFNTLIVPYEHIIELNGRLRSVALAPRTQRETEHFFRKIDRMTASSPDNAFYEAVEGFLSRLSVAVFVGRGDRVTVYSSIGVTSVSGMGRLILPILIAALLVLNTMMGAVHERFREIGVYSAVGLAPSHVSALFFAEAFVFATIGVVLGYLLGQATTMVMTTFNVLEGLNLNYSSVAAVNSSLIVMAVVMLSAAYPARKAAEMSVQDVSRRWTLPEPDGDTWTFEFPFTVSGVEAPGISAYLVHVFRAHEHGVAEGFVTDGAQLRMEGVNGRPAYRVEASTWLAPFDLGVSQRTTLTFRPMEDDPTMYRIDMQLVRKSGDLSSWTDRNRAFLKLLRKRFLVWRTMGQKLKEAYAVEGAREIASA